MATDSQHWAQVPLGFEIPIGVKQPPDQCRNIGNHRLKRKAWYQVQALGLVVLVCVRDLRLVDNAKVSAGQARILTFLSAKNQRISMTRWHFKRQGIGPLISESPKH